ncbi:MAG: phage holin family protein [Bacteroidetes bacterium]|nr:phage holin family protein [Bacteroidota bacterium]
MEQTTERPEVVTEDETPGGPFSKGAKKVESIAQQSNGLFDDVKEWIDLKIQFTWLDIQAKIDAVKQDAVVGAIVAVLGILGFVFALLTGALGLGAWLGHPAWGFLIVTGVLFLTAGVVYGWHFERGKKKKKSPGAPSEHKELEAQDDQKRLPPAAPAP